jgi:hypothetical protein
MSADFWNLPPDAVEFLRRGGQLDYDPSLCEPGEVTLKRLEQLELGEVWVGTDMDGDPNEGQDGYYAIPAVSLIAECEGYDPEFILLWLPNEKLFGAWDNDHWKLDVFHGCSWSDIVAQPEIYLNAQWDPASGVGTPFSPWLHYELKPGMPF